MIVTPSHTIPKNINHGVFTIPLRKYCKELEDVIAVAKSYGYQLPTDYQLRVLNQYINEQIINKIWHRRDLLYIFGYNDLDSFSEDNFKNLSIIRRAQLNRRLTNFVCINLKQPNRYKITPTLDSISGDTMSLTNKGFIKFSATEANYLETDYNLSTGDTYTQNDASITCYLPPLHDLADSSQLIFSNSINSNNFRMNVWSATNTHPCGINSVSASFGTATSGFGYHHVERTASNAMAWYRNGSAYGTRSDTSNAPINATIRIGTRLRPSISFASVGGSLNATLQKIDWEIFTEFRTKLGY